MKKQNDLAMAKWHNDQIKEELKETFGEHYHTEDVINFLSARIARLEHNHEELLKMFANHDTFIQGKFKLVSTLFEAHGKEIRRLFENCNIVDKKIVLVAELVRAMNPFK